MEIARVQPKDGENNLIDTYFFECTACTFQMEEDILRES
jgi:hypothetical protein